MADEIGDKIKSLLSNPEAMNMLSSLMGNNASLDADENYDGQEDEFVTNVKNVLSRVNNGSDKRINLLNALKPYMRQSRSSNIDKAIKMLKISQMTSLFKDL